MNVFMFYLFAGIILICSILTITSRRILRAAVYLLCVLLATASLYFMLNYQFLAAVQLALYAGGIVVLIIFSILLTSHITQRFNNPDISKILMGVGVAAVGSVLVIATILSHPFQPGPGVELPVNMTEIGTQLLSTGKNGYALPFELISILLLAAMIAAIIIAKKDKNKNTTI